MSSLRKADSSAEPNQQLDSEAWVATGKMRQYLTRLRQYETNHIKEHECRYPCIQLADNYHAQAWVVTEIKKALEPPQDYYTKLDQQRQLISLLDQGLLKPESYLLEMLGLDATDSDTEGAKSSENKTLRTQARGTLPERGTE